MPLKRKVTKRVESSRPLGTYRTSGLTEKGGLGCAPGNFRQHPSENRKKEALASLGQRGVRRLIFFGPFTITEPSSMKRSGGERVGSGGVGRERIPGRRRKREKAVREITHFFRVVRMTGIKSREKDSARSAEA